MKKYVFVYYNGGDPSQTSKEDMEQIMADWGKWYEELGSAVVDGGNPFAPGGQEVSADKVEDIGGAENWHSSGYTIVNAESMEAAVKMAQSNPMHRHTDGQAVVRVYEAMPM